LVPLALDVAAGRVPSLIVNGVDWDTPDGTCVRDYIHVSDLAAAHSLAVDRLRQGGGGDVFNLGIDRGYSVRDVVSACERVTGRSIVLREGPRRVGDPARLVAAADKVTAGLGWRPRVTDLEEMVASSWRWRNVRRY
jgi:UDP-glucose 4-epimerase